VTHLSFIVLLALVTAPAPAALTESQAIEIVSLAVRQVNPGAPPDRCLAYQVEGKTLRAFDIAVRERHEGSCPGDPGTMPVIERFRVTRSPVTLWHYDVMIDAYDACPLTRALRPQCLPQHRD
jgi:hypothetical protein